MTRLISAAIFVLGLFVLTSGNRGLEIRAAAAGTEDPHAYFNALVARSEHWRSYSLRDQEQLLHYRASKSREPSVTYDPAHDPDPRRQDAAKVVVPAFVDMTTLAAPVRVEDTTITLAEARPTYLSQYVKNRQVRVDREVMTVTGRSGSTVFVNRGALGTTAISHSAGATVGAGTSSIANQVLLPLGTEDGHTYVATWDAWYGSELRHSQTGLTNWKTFRLDSPRKVGGSNLGLWVQVNTNFRRAPNSDYIGTVDARASAPFGPNVTRTDPITPQVGTLAVRPETWIRYWVLFDQRAGDWDLMTMWAASEDQDAVKINDAAQLENFGNLALFRIEYNTSTSSLVTNRDPIVSYVRNFVMLRDVANPEALMKRPNAGVALPPISGPAAPRNLRIVTSK